MRIKFIIIILLLLLIGCSQSDQQTNTTNDTANLLNETNVIQTENIIPIVSNSTLPVVAIHISENSQQNWQEQPFSNKIEGYASLQIILDSQKIPYIILSDKDIENNKLMINDKVKYPILFSINNPKVSPNTVSKIEEYVANGGTIFFNSNSFTEKNCFTLQVQISCIQEFFKPDTAQKIKSHSSIDHIPRKEVVWTTPHVVALVNSSKTHVTNSRGDRIGSMIIIDGGYIYHSNFRPFWARLQGNPNVMNTFFAMNLIEDSFEKHNLPLLQIEPWGNYSAAFIQRFDVEPRYDDLLELFPKFVNVSERHNISAVFYMLVDQVRSAEFADISEWQVFRAKNPKVSSMMLEAKDKGMIIASHSTWHLGPDVDPKPKENIKQSLDILEEVMQERTDQWVSPNLLAQKHSSLELIDELGIKTTGEQMITFLPHYGISPDDNSRFIALQLPISTNFNHGPLDPDYFAFVLEHQTKKTISQTVDLYYEHNGLINIYAHLTKDNVDKLDHLYQYVKDKEDIWITTPNQILEYHKAYNQLTIEDVRVNQNTIQFTLANSGNQTTAHINLPGKMFIEQKESNGTITIGKEKIMITVKLNE